MYSLGIDTANNLIDEFENRPSSVLNGSILTKHDHIDHDRPIAERIYLLAHSLANRFTVSNLGFANVGFDIELASHTIDNDFQMQLTHT